MTPRKKDDLHRNLTTILASISSVLLSFAIALLVNLTSKVNSITVDKAVDKEILDRHEIDIRDLKTKLANIKL